MNPEGFQSEERFRVGQRMETLGRLVAGASHDLNNLLSVISGYSSLLQMKFSKAGTSHRELVEIEKAVSKATALVGQLLAFSRRPAEHFQLFDLATLISESLPLLQSVLGDGIAVETSFEKNLGRVMLDRSHFEQALMNMIVNAKDAMPRGGRLFVGLAACELDQDHFQEDEDPLPGKYLCLTIRDSGVGMETETLPHIFEPFFTNKNEANGSGLGLFTAYRIIQETGGNIRVESSANNGTTFSLYFQRAADPDGDSPQFDTESSQVSKAPEETILLIENDVDLRRMAKDILVLEGYHVLEAKRLEDALGFAKAEELKIDLLLTDLFMLRLQGSDIAETILALRPGIKVLCMSGQAPDLLTAPNAHISESTFLEMPFTPAQLSAKIRETLDAQRA